MWSIWLGNPVVKEQFMKTQIFICFVLIFLISACGRSPIAPGISGPTPPAAENTLGDTRPRQVDGASLVFVPGGTFPMGSSPDQIEDAIAMCQQHYSICNRWYYERQGPQHLVTLDDFWIDQNEVSNAQYRQCVEAGVCSELLDCKKGQPTYPDPQKASHPVVCVDWQDAQTYCEWAGGRLPTEAEWEYAFRGEAGSLYPWGDVFDGAKVNYCDNNCGNAFADDRFDDGYPKTSPRGSYPEGISWCGALGMAGNVAEWTADWLGDFSPEAISNPDGPASGDEKIIKGCSWYFPPVYCRGATRGSVAPETRLDYLGFRCAVMP
jgi:formylglycine-generating enzyme required for sulfatase activity